MSKKNINITVVSLCYWPEKAGGAPPVQQMAESLAKNGVKVTVVTTRPSYPEKEIFPEYRDGSRDKEIHNGVSIIRIPAPPQKGGILSILKAEGIHALGAWWTLIRRPNPEVVISISPSILAVAATQLALSKKVHRIAIVHDIQSGLAKSLNITKLNLISSFLKKIEKNTLNNSDHIVTLSDAMKKVLHDIGIKRPITIIPPTVDDEAIQPLPEPAGPITLLYSGNIGRKQGLDQIADLAENLQLKEKNCIIIIRGNGNYLETLKNNSKTKGLKNLKFEPFTPIEHLSEGLSQGHIHLVPQDPASAAFCVPSKIYAIMAAGRPFVCTAEPNSPLDLLSKKSGGFLVCPPNDPKKMLATIEKLLTDSQARLDLGRKGRCYVEKYAGKATATEIYFKLVKTNFYTKNDF